MTVDVAQDARAAAAEARRAALGGGVGGGAQERSSVLPREEGTRQEVPCEARMEASLVTRGDQQLYHLTGIASVTDKPYRMWDAFGEYDEVVTREAFTDTLRANPDVSFLLNHKGLTMARTHAGTLELRMAESGLQSDAWLNPKRQDVKDLVVAIEDANITEMSFAFMLQKGEWSEDFTQFRITRLDINRGDVSAVNYGANPHTSIAARSPEILATLKYLPTGAARAALAELNARSDIRAAAVLLEPAPEPAPAPAPVDRLESGASISFYEHLFELT